MGWVRPEETAPGAVVLPSSPPAAPVRSAASGSNVHSRREAQGERWQAATAGPGGRPPAIAPSAPARPVTPVTERNHTLPAVLPYAVIMAIISAVFVWNYTINQSGAGNPFAVLWNAFTTRVPPACRWSVRRCCWCWCCSPGWWAESWRSVRAKEEAGARFSATVPACCSTSAIAITTFLVWGLVQALSHRLERPCRGSMSSSTSLSHIVVFDGVLFLLMIALAASLALHFRPWPQRFAQRTAASLSAAVVLTALAIFVIVKRQHSRGAGRHLLQAGHGLRGRRPMGRVRGAVPRGRRVSSRRKTTTTCSSAGRCCSSPNWRSPGTAVLPDDLSNVPTDGLLDHGGSRHPGARLARTSCVRPMRRWSVRNG